MADTLTEPYRESFVMEDEHPNGLAGFVCNIDGRPVDDGPCPDHAPMSVPGLRVADCTATPAHPPVFHHLRDDYGVPCLYCVIAEHAEQERVAQQCRHWGWRTWRATRWAASVAYSLGIIAGYGTTWGDGHKMCTTFTRGLRGKRSYVLGVSRDTWECWSRGHLRGEPVGFGFCGKCVPWPCCGSITEDHIEGCAEDERTDALRPQGVS